MVTGRQRGSRMHTATDHAAQEKDSRECIEALVTPEQKALLEQAAAARGLPLGDFVGESLGRLASTLPVGREVIVLGPEDSAAFVDAILNPPEPSPRLRAVARRQGFTTG